MRVGPCSAAGKAPPLACALLALACGERAEAPGFRGFADEVVLESEHFRFHVHADDGDACEGAVAELERHFQAISAYLGSGAPGAAIDYYKFASVDELQGAGACSLGQSPACVHDGQVRTAKLFDAHELIHAYVEPSRPPWIFVEGLADVLSCSYGPWSRPRDHASFEDVSALDWQALASWVPSSAAGDLTYYRAGAQLMRYLIDRHGVEQVMAHYREARSTTTPDEVNADFEESFAESLAAAWSAALALDLPGGPCLTPFECSHPPIEIGDSWSVEARCGAGYDYRTLELARASALVLSAPGARDVLGERDSLDMLLACDGLVPAPLWTSFYPPRLATVLAAGRYALVLPRPQPSGLRAELSSFAVASDCEAALAAPLMIEAGETTLAISTGETDTFVALSAATPLTIERQTATRASIVMLCRGCSSAATCAELSNAVEGVDAMDAVLQLKSSSAVSEPTLIGIRAGG